METLLLNIKNEVVSHQTFMRKKNFEKIEWLKKELENLKSDYVANADVILNHEKLLNNLTDAEMRAELEKNRNYDILVNEKMVPRFLTLSKIKHNESLDLIRREDGSDFDTAEERHEFIRSFYEDIYNAAPGNEITENSINDFLAEEICNNPIVKGSKLTGTEREFFDRPITINELDKAILNLSEKSAGGLDGISTKFLKKYWVYIRLSLFRYTTYCFESGNLTQSFNSAGIKLIPKKGDLSKIKNWRPISLLNSVFKIISKAVDNRLA
jgi:hypothetical protein